MRDLHTSDMDSLDGSKPGDAIKSTDNMKDGPAVTALSTDEHNSQASIAAHHEHNLSFSEAVRSYPAAVFWSFFFSLGVIMAVRFIHALRKRELELICTGIRPSAHRQPLRNTCISERLRLSV